MQIVSLEQLKSILNITHSAQDTRLTYLANIAEGEILDYIGAADMDAFYTMFGEEEIARASLQQAVIFVVDQRFHGVAIDVRGNPMVIRTLIKYRVPMFSSGTTA